MKIGVIYASLSGNTEAIADLIIEELKEQGHDVDVEEFLNLTSASNLLNYDATFVGMYTWGDGEYPDECLDIMEEFEELELDGHRFALFGSGDTSYDDFCGALDLMKNVIDQQGGQTIAEPLRIEFNPEPEDEDAIKKFVADALERLA